MRSIETDMVKRPHELVEMAEAVSELEGHPGLEAIMEAVNQRKLDLLAQLTSTPPTDQGAVYAQKLGQIQGLEEVPLILAGIVTKGRKAEIAVREEMELANG